MKIKTLSIKDLRAKKPAELEQYVAELKTNQAELVHLMSINKEKQTHQLSVIKRAIAQAKTVQAQAAKEEEK